MEDRRLIRRTVDVHETDEFPGGVLYSAQQLVGSGLEMGNFLKLVQNDDQPIFRVARVVEQRQSILQGCFPIGGSFKGNFNAGGLGVDRHRRPAKRLPSTTVLNLKGLS